MMPKLESFGLCTLPVLTDRYRKAVVLRHRSPKKIKKNLLTGTKLCLVIQNCLKHKIPFNLPLDVFYPYCPFYASDYDTETIQLSYHDRKSHAVRNTHDQWVLQDQCALLYEYLEGATSKESCHGFTRTVGGMENEMDKMTSQYGTISLHKQKSTDKNKIRKNKESNRIKWAVDTHYFCVIRVQEKNNVRYERVYREGHIVTLNEVYWVLYRWTYGLTTDLFSGMSWSRTSEELGRSISECKKIFGALVAEILAKRKGKLQIK